MAAFAPGAASRAGSVTVRRGGVSCEHMFADKSVPNESEKKIVRRNGSGSSPSRCSGQLRRCGKLGAGTFRGFDRLDFGQRSTPRYALISADAAIPYRTSIVTAPRARSATINYPGLGRELAEQPW